jgi:hypothetical protein
MFRMTYISNGFVAGLRALTSLNLSNCRQVSDDGLRSLANLTALTSVHLQGIVDMAERLPSVRARHAAYTDHIGPAVAFLRERAVAGARLPPHVPSAESILSPQQLAAAPNPKAQKTYTAVLLSREW